MRYGGKRYEIWGRDMRYGTCFPFAAGEVATLDVGGVSLVVMTCHGVGMSTCSPRDETRDARYGTEI